MHFLKSLMQHIFLRHIISLGKFVLIKNHVVKYTEGLLIMYKTQKALLPNEMY